MTLPVFVVDPDALRAEVITLDGDEGRHAASAKRIRVGERITLTDGLGFGADCEVLSLTKASLQCAVRVRRQEPAAVPHLTVVQAIPKGDHGDRAVDLLTEVGVDEIVPWAASRNVAVWRGERAAKGAERWRSVAVAAAKQSRRLRFPEVRALHATGEATALLGRAGLGVVLHESADRSLADLLAGSLAGPAAASGQLPPSEQVVIVVGPEGGITDEELVLFEAAGARVCRLGPTVLRASTAGVVAASLVLSHTDRWRTTR